MYDADNPGEMNPDGEAVYDEKISPVVKKLIALCKKHKLPLLVAVQLTPDSAEEGRKGGFCTTRIPFDDESVKLKEACKVVYRGQTHVREATITVTDENGKIKSIEKVIG